jgi:hypothetical protein
VTFSLDCPSQDAGEESNNDQEAREVCTKTHAVKADGLDGQHCVPASELEKISNLHGNDPARVISLHLHADSLVRSQQEEKKEHWGQLRLLRTAVPQHWRRGTESSI